jgi:hypothetical protein
MGRVTAAFVAALAFAAIIVPLGSASSGGSFTCTGGSIPAGTYASLTIAGPCALDSGSVSVVGNATVASGGELLAAFGGSDLTVGRNLSVLNNGILVLGCEPEAFTCFNDPDQVVGTLSTNDRIGGNLTSTGALAVLVHHSAVTHNVVQSGGGGGVNCHPQDALGGAPFYATYEDVSIGGNAVITGFRSCWAGFIRNTVGGNVIYNNNVTFDPDGNEIVTNTIAGTLACAANSPKPQVGDSFGSPNVAARATGQCKDLVG